MSCDISKGINSLKCKNNVAGLRAIYVANYAEYDFTETSDDTTGHQITGLPVELIEVFKFPLKNTGNDFSEEIASNRDNGTTVFNGTLNFVLTKIDALKQFQIQNLAWGRPIIFVETNANDIFIMGKENGVEVTGNSTIEGSMDGVNAYQLTGASQERESVHFLDEDTTEALKGLVDEANSI